MNAQQLLFRTMQKQYNSMVDFSNIAFNKYQKLRKEVGPVDASLCEYATAAAYDTAAKSVMMIAEINGIPLIERVTKYANDVAFESDRYSEPAEVEVEELEEA